MRARARGHQLGEHVDRHARAAKHRIPLMILPFNRSLVGARVERISSARAPEMCPFEKQSKNIKTVRRKLAAIFAADVAGYSRLMARDA